MQEAIQQGPWYFLNTLELLGRKGEMLLTKQDPAFSSPLKARSVWPQSWPLVQVADAVVGLWVGA